MSSAPAKPVFHSAHLIRSQPIDVSVEKQPQGWIVHIKDGGETRRFRLHHQDRQRPLPEALDAIAFCTLPLALRSRRMLHIHGPLTRTALRNLRELGEMWSSWNSEMFSAVDVGCEGVIDNAVSENTSVIAAWSGDLRSTFSIAGGEASLRDSDFQIGTAVHVLGLAEPALQDDVLRDVRKAFGSEGVELALVSTDAAAAGIIDPTIGVTPIIAAALHLVGHDLASTAIQTESHPVRSQLIRPRQRPTSGSFYSGDNLEILSVGGVESLPQIVDFLARKPDFAPLVLGCRATGFNTPRCGHCDNCKRLDLGLQGAGITLPGDRTPGAFDWNGSDLETEGILALNDWSGRLGPKMQLATRLFRSEISRALSARAAWQKAMKGEAPPWPR